MGSYRPHVLVDALNENEIHLGTLEDVHEGTTLQLLRSLIQGLFEVNTIYAFESASGRVRTY